MGRFSITSETAFSQPREVVFDFATNPNNWGRTYKGSGGMNHDVKVPVEHGTSTVIGHKHWLDSNTQTPNLIPLLIYNR